MCGSAAGLRRAGKVGTCGAASWTERGPSDAAAARAGQVAHLVSVAAASQREVVERMARVQETEARVPLAHEEVQAQHQDVCVGAGALRFDEIKAARKRPGLARVAPVDDVQDPKPFPVPFAELCGKREAVRTRVGCDENIDGPATRLERGDERFVPAFALLARRLDQDPSPSARGGSTRRPRRRRDAS